MKRCLSDLYYNHAIKTVVVRRAKQQAAKTYYYLFSYIGDEVKIKEPVPRPSSNITHRRINMYCDIMYVNDYIGVHEKL